MRWMGLREGWSKLLWLHNSIILLPSCLMRPSLPQLFQKIQMTLNSIKKAARSVTLISCVTSGEGNQQIKSKIGENHKSPPAQSTTLFTVHVTPVYKCRKQSIIQFNSISKFKKMNVFLSTSWFNSRRYWWVSGSWDPCQMWKECRMLQSAWTLCLQVPAWVWGGPGFVGGLSR